MSIEEFRKDVKLIVSEVDGVITDGMRAEDEMGHVLYKHYNVRDFEALNELKKDFKFVFLSDDNAISYNMCRRKNIPFYWAPTEDEKYESLVKILRRYECTPDQTIYIASKISDRKCVRLIPKSMCPDDAGMFLREICFTSFVTRGGQGIMVELLDLLKNSNSEVEIFQ